VTGEPVTQRPQEQVQPPTQIETGNQEEPDSWEDIEETTPATGTVGVDKTTTASSTEVEPTGQRSPTPEGASEPKKEVDEGEVVVAEQQQPSGTVGEKKKKDKVKNSDVPSKSESTSSKIKDNFPIKDTKENMNIIFIGHVDAGKSTIGGQLMYLTGQVDKRTLEKFEREAKSRNRETWYLSWALDLNPEEREKGKTVEVGRAYFETDKKRFHILDAPGHAGFVPNMIGGAAQADIAILVISARRGEFETGFEKGGQTREHTVLVKTAGAKHLIVLINKMDDPTVEWSEERYEECKVKLLPYLKKVGFNPNRDIHVMPVSGYLGTNLKDVDRNACPFYTGPSFLEYLDSLGPLNREDTGPVRLPILDRFKDKGTFVIGKLEGGTLVKGQMLTMMPNKVSVEVLQVCRNEQEIQKGFCGDNLKIKLKGVEEEEISSGFVLCSSDSLCRVGRVFDAQIAILESKSIICAGYGAVMHIHTLLEEVQLKVRIEQDVFILITFARTYVCRPSVV
jgi:peptide chain release factor subunit 3